MTKNYHCGRVGRRDGSIGRTSIRPTPTTSSASMPARLARRCRARDRGGQGERSRPGRAPRSQERHDILKARRRRDPRAQGRARPPAVARGGQDPGRGHRRDRPRRPDLPVLLRRVPAPGRREGRLRAAGRRRRDHPRAGRRRRPDHAVELPDRHSGLEDRAGARLRQLRRVQAGRSRAGDRPMRWPRSSPAPACRRACSTSSWAAARWSARRCCRAQGRQRDLLHRLGRDRAQGRRRPASPPTR